MQNEIKNILRENKSQFQMMMYGFCLVGLLIFVMFGFIVWIVIVVLKEWTIIVRGWENV